MRNPQPRSERSSFSPWRVSGATRHSDSPLWLWKIKYDRCTMHINTHDAWTSGILVEYLPFCSGLAQPRLRVKGRVLNLFPFCDSAFGLVQKERNETHFSLKSARRVCVRARSSRLRFRANHYSERTVCTVHQKAERVARGETPTDLMCLMNGRRKAPWSQIPTSSTPRTPTPGYYLLPCVCMLS